MYCAKKKKKTINKINERKDKSKVESPMHFLMTQRAAFSTGILSETGILIRLIRLFFQSAHRMKETQRYFDSP